MTTGPDSVQRSILPIPDRRYAGTVLYDAKDPDARFAPIEPIRWSLTSQVEIPTGGANGVLLNLGGTGGGWSFYLKDGSPTFCYNLLGLDRTYVRSAAPVPAGEHQVRLEFAYDGGGLGKGGTVTLYLDGAPTGSGRVEHTEPIGFGYECTDVGRDGLSPVTDEYTNGDNAFTGMLKWIELEGGQDSHDHLIDPEDFICVARARQ